MWWRHGGYRVDVASQLVRWVTLYLLAQAWLCSASTSLCRSVNYILDSLPQQCPTSLHPPNQAPSIGGTDSLIASATSLDASPFSYSPNETSREEARSTPLSSANSVPANQTTQSVMIDTQTSKSEVESTSTAAQESDGSSNEDGFLSFEDWKRLNLLQSVQVHDENGEQVHPPKVREAPQPRDRPHDHAIDSIGDEIDIQIEPSTYGKTSKERFNYASFDCAAAVLKSNPEAKGSSSILDENRDRYMLNKCSASNKFVIVEMCEDILVDTVVLANFEFFSSTFKEFHISVSDRHPTSERGWKSLGTFMANNTRAIQVFAVENPLIWARYVRIEFISHYGSEFYCPLTLLRIHGTTMMEEYKNQENGKLEEVLQDSSNSISLSEATGSVPIETVYDSSNRHPSMPTLESFRLVDNLSSNDAQGVPKVRINHTDSDSTPLILDVSTSSEHTTNLSGNSLTELPSNTSQLNISGETQSRSTDDESPTTASPSAIISNSKSSELVQDNISNVSVAASEKSETASMSVSPTTQESVYKTITKRLSLLEANATLSLRYIEEQSQLLRDVFNKMERRHSAKIDAVLSELNVTWVTQMQYFRMQYEQLWQSTIVELESQKESSREEIIAISARLSLLADELLFQKRMSIAHSIMLLVTLLFVLTTRGVTLDLQSPSRMGILAETPATSPVMDRAISGFLQQRERQEMERRLNTSPEYGKLNRSWQRINVSGESIQSAPTTPAAVSRRWHSSGASALNHYHTFSDTDNSDTDYGEMARELGGESSLDHRGATDADAVEIADYPTPSSNEELNE